MKLTLLALLPGFLLGACHPHEPVLVTQDTAVITQSQALPLLVSGTIDYARAVRENDFRVITTVVNDENLIPEWTDADERSYYGILFKEGFNPLQLSSIAKGDWKTLHQKVQKFLATYETHSYARLYRQFAAQFMLKDVGLLAKKGPDADKAVESYLGLLVQTRSANAGMLYFGLKTLQSGDQKSMLTRQAKEVCLPECSKRLAAMEKCCADSKGTSDRQKVLTLKEQELQKQMNETKERMATETKYFIAQLQTLSAS